MIAFLSGVVVEKASTSILVETSGGVGYDVIMTAADVLTITVGEKMRVYTYLKISDSAQELFGFRTTAVRDFFKLLLTVSGIGPKSALTILSLGDIEQIQVSIARGDIAYLTGVQGMGKKTAERLVLELKSKLKNQSAHNLETGPGTSESLDEIIEALVSMGYSQSEARDVVQNLDVKNKNSEGLLREALKMLAR